MKKAGKREKKDTMKKSSAPGKNNQAAVSDANGSRKRKVSLQAVKSNTKKAKDKKNASDSGIIRHIGQARQFLRESRVELKKVKWPTKKELMATTAVVVFISLLMAVYFGLVDWVLSFMYKLQG